MIGANISSWLILNMDSVVVGRSLGPGVLGVYNRAMMLVAAPAHGQSQVYRVCFRRLRARWK